LGGHLEEILGQLDPFHLYDIGVHTFQQLVQLGSVLVRGQAPGHVRQP
jgi:hypothetical protein